MGCLCSGKKLGRRWKSKYFRHSAQLWTPTDPNPSAPTTRRRQLSQPQPSIFRLGAGGWTHPPHCTRRYLPFSVCSRCSTSAVLSVSRQGQRLRFPRIPSARSGTRQNSHLHQGSPWTSICIAFIYFSRLLGCCISTCSTPHLTALPRSHRLVPRWIRGRRPQQ